ncbi:hypothetical protein Tco_0789298 [Tanacetum coccineum]
MGSLEFRTEETQTTIPTPPSSPRRILSSDKKIDQELTDNVANPTTTSSKHSQSKRQISNSYSHISGAFHRMCRRQGYIIQNLKKCVTTDKFWEYHNKVEQALKEAIPEIAENATNDLIGYNLKPCITATIIEDRDAFRSEIPTFVSQEFKTHAPRIISELFNEYVQSNVIHVHPTITPLTTPISSTELQYQLYLKMKSSLQDQADDVTLWEALKCKFENSSTYNTSCREDEFHSYHDEHHDDDAHPEGEKRVKRSKESKRPKSTRGSSSKHSTPILTFPGIEEYTPYSIVDKPQTGLIYLNSKEEKRVMYLVEIVKFCDATLEKVLNEVKLIMFDSQFLKKPPLLIFIQLNMISKTSDIKVPTYEIELEKTAFGVDYGKSDEMDSRSSKVNVESVADSEENLGGCLDMDSFDNENRKLMDLKLKDNVSLFASETKPECSEVYIVTDHGLDVNCMNVDDFVKSQVVADINDVVKLYKTEDMNPVGDISNKRSVIGSYGIENKSKHEMADVVFNDVGLQVVYVIATLVVLHVSVLKSNHITIIQVRGVGGARSGAELGRAAGEGVGGWVRVHASNEHVLGAGKMSRGGRMLDIELWDGVQRISTQRSTRASHKPSGTPSHKINKDLLASNCIGELLKSHHELESATVAETFTILSDKVFPYGILHIQV